jgi:hypothetical protein
VLREQLGLTGANAVARKADVAQPGFRQAEGRLPGMLHG